MHFKWLISKIFIIKLWKFLYSFEECFFSVIHSCKKLPQRQMSQHYFYFYLFFPLISTHSLFPLKSEASERLRKEIYVLYLLIYKRVRASVCMCVVKCSTTNRAIRQTFTSWEGLNEIGNKNRTLTSEGTETLLKS